MFEKVWEFSKGIGGFAFIFFGVVGGVILIFGTGDSDQEVATADEDSFTVSCQARYSLEDNSGRIDFKVTINPRLGHYFQFDWEGTSTRQDDTYSYDRGHEDMTNEISTITEISPEIIKSGKATIDRITGKYDFREYTTGPCRKIRHIPIPESSF